MHTEVNWMKHELDQITPLFILTVEVSQGHGGCSECIAASF